MPNFLASLKGMPPRRALARVMGYGLFGGEVVGCVLMGLAVVATVLGAMQAGG